LGGSPRSGTRRSRPTIPYGPGTGVAGDVDFVAGDETSVAGDAGA
jgi:hypothetical protein